MEPPLQGIKVVELGEWVFVPSAAAVLGDWGAEVVKIEMPQRGDGLRGILNARRAAGFDVGPFDYLVEQANRGKRSIGVDLHHPEGQTIVRKLVEGTDVFITSLLEPSREQLHMTMEDLSKIRPDIVYARGHGQGQHGPESDHGAIDSVAFWARGGVGAALTGSRDEFVHQRQAFGDFIAGMFLAGGIAAALYRRAETGEGALVDASLLGAAAWAMSPDILSSHYAGMVAPMGGKGAPQNPLAGMYKTEDDRLIALGMIQADRYWSSFCRVTGIEEFEDRFDSMAKRAHNEELFAAICNSFGSKPLHYWRTRLRDSDCVWAPVQTPREVPDDLQVRANGYVVDHPTVDGAALVSNPIQFDNEATSFSRGAPEVGQHTEEILLELGYEWEDIGQLKHDLVIT